MFEALAQRGADIPMSPSSMDELPIAGKLISASNIGIGEYAYSNIAARSSEKSASSAHVGSKNTSSHGSNDNGSDNHSDDSHDNH